jgi:hypothetical protein
MRELGLEPVTGGSEATPAVYGERMERLFQAHQLSGRSFFAVGYVIILSNAG